MKKLIALAIGIACALFTFAQSPQKMSYQSVIRDATSDLVTETTVGIQISIVQGTPGGTAVYVETHLPMTNINGLASMEIGTGTPVSGTFAAIDWGAGPYFIKTETDPTGGTSYTLSGTSELLSVPYALYAAGTDETDPIYSAWDKSTGISITESQISDLDHFTSADETDPIFTSSPVFSIGSSEIDDWNAAFSFFDPFDLPTSGAIGASDIALWNASLTSEVDPEVGANTTDQVPKWDGSALVAGSISDVAGNIGIGISAPVQKLHVNMYGASAAGVNTVMKLQATGAVITTGGGTALLFSGESSAGGISNYDHARMRSVGYINNNMHGLAFDVRPDAGTALSEGMRISPQGQLGIGTTTPEPSAQLDVSSTTKGFLPPRMTEAERNSITTPVAGLILWCNDCGDNGEVQVFNGTTWTNIVGGTASIRNPAVGDIYQGGIIAYIYTPADPGWSAGETHGIIVAPADLTGIWGCPNSFNPFTSSLVGFGQANTNEIINWCPDQTAARACNDLVIGIYDDWYLPSLGELAEIYLNKELFGLADEYYWSSTQYCQDYNNWQCFDRAYRFLMTDGTYTWSNKYDSWLVRAVRSF